MTKYPEQINNKCGIFRLCLKFRVFQNFLSYCLFFQRSPTSEEEMGWGHKRYGMWVS